MVDDAIKSVHTLFFTSLLVLLLWRPHGVLPAKSLS